MINLVLSDFKLIMHSHAGASLPTGQAFTPEALARVWELTQGQPWLVNALAYRATFEIRSGRDRSRSITVELIDQAKDGYAE